MKIKDVLKMNSQDLENKVATLKQELFDLRFQLALGKLTNTAQIRKLKKSIARMKTILTQQNTDFINSTLIALSSQKPQKNDKTKIKLKTNNQVLEPSKDILPSVDVKSEDKKIQSPDDTNTDKNEEIIKEEN
ncbi:Ribosomal protein L29 [Candidatus Phytoplasma solani]|nr:Ribosomal protein L29 [Candidatus Phytoplasma solani]